MTEHPDLQRYRDWLANEHNKAVRADQAGDVPPELRISPHNGIAAGLAIALHGLDRILGALEHAAGPSTAECAAADRRWPLEKEGQ
jgi:hypothetical protein